MLGDDEFYAAINPHLRAKSAGHVGEITSSDASATRSNGEKDPDRVTESYGPDDPKLSIIVNGAGSAVPESQRTSHYRPSRSRKSQARMGWAIPIFHDSNPHIHGEVTISDWETQATVNVQIKEVRAYERHSARPDFGILQTVALVLQNMQNPEVSYIITFDGETIRDGEFRTVEPELDNLANGWMIRYAMTKPEFPGGRK